jgi:hypothetical protein
VKGLFDGLRHLVLAFAVLEGERGARENSSRREELVQRRKALSGLESGRKNRNGRGCGQGEEAAKASLVSIIDRLRCAAD